MTERPIIERPSIDLAAALAALIAAEERWGPIDPDNPPEMPYPATIGIEGDIGLRKRPGGPAYIWPRGGKKWIVWSHPILKGQAHWIFWHSCTLQAPRFNPETEAPL